MIKGLSFSILLCALVYTAPAQEITALEMDTLEVQPPEKFRVYLGASYSGQQFAETMASFVNISGGIFYKNHFEARVSYGTIINDFKKQIIFPTTFSFDQSNLLFQLQYNFFNTRIRPVAGFGVNLGQVSWLPQGDIEDVYSDNIITYGAYVGASWAINKSMILQGDIGYSQIAELELVGLEEGDFNGIRFEVQLKFGIFHFK